MKINETKPIITKKLHSAVKAYHLNDQQMELADRLRRLGWKYLNKGWFSSVWYNPKKSYVLKINMDEDAGYAAYVKLIRKYKNPHFPIISDMKSWEVNGEKYYVYLIEKLFPMPETEQTYKISDCIEAIAEDPFASLKEIFGGVNNVTTIIRENPKLIEAARIIGKTAYKGLAGLDIHSGNIMRRLNGTIVITDPYV